MRDSRLKARINQQRHTSGIHHVCLRCQARERCFREKTEQLCRKVAQVRRWTDLAREARFRANDLAALNGICVRQLERQFHDLLGCRPQEWLYHLLTVHVQRLLLSGKSLKEAAAQLGFAYPGNLSRCFKRLTGITVSQFLAQQMSPVDSSMSPLDSSPTLTLSG
jgi:AraC-like DNA-binding protein